MTATFLVLSLVLARAIFADRYHGDREKECTRGDAKLVQREWNSLWLNTEPRFKVALAKKAILLVVEVHPDSIELFRGVGIDDPNSGEFEAHCLRIFNQVDHLVGLLHNKETVREASKHLGSQHAVRPGVLGRYFETFKTITFGYFVHAIDNLHHFSWNTCFKTIFQGVFDVIPD